MNRQAMLPFSAKCLHGAYIVVPHPAECPDPSSGKIPPFRRSRTFREVDNNPVRPSLNDKRRLALDWGVLRGANPWIPRAKTRPTSTVNH